MLTANGVVSVLEVNNGPEVAARHPEQHPINHQTHERLLGELLPLVAEPRAPPRPHVDTFLYLLHCHVLHDGAEERGGQEPAVQKYALCADVNISDAYSIITRGLLRYRYRLALH